MANDIMGMFTALNNGTEGNPAEQILGEERETW